MRCRSLTLAVVVCLAGSAFAEDPEPRRFEFRETHMGSEFKILVYGRDENAASAAAAEAFRRIADLDACYSDYDPESELSRLSARSGGPAVPVSADLLDILLRAREFSRDSDGAFDVTILPVVKLWRRARRMRELPDPQLLAEARKRVGWQLLEIDPQSKSVRLPLEGMGLDLGGIAKGYAADEALKVLREKGFRRALVAAAGDIVVGDPPPNARGWLIALQTVEQSDGSASRFIPLANAAVSTSGDAERFVEIGGVRYSHIVDPRTGLGLTGRTSVTVVAPNGTTSDSLATAVSVLGPERGLELVERTQGVAALIARRVEGNGLEVVESARFREIPAAEPSTEAVRP